MAEVQGTCEAQFEAVRRTLIDSLDAGRDVGASVAVRVDGRPVVDIWGGHADEARTIPWGRDTITNVWSTTKTMTFLCALMLADRGVLDFSAPVGTYWPEFAAGGKEAVEVRHLMSHTAGLAGFTELLQPEDLADWEKCTSLLAAQEPWWEPGTAAGYHAITQGYLIGEVVRRITGVTVGSWFASEVAGPLGADFHIGLPATEDARVSPVIPPEPMDASGHEPTSIPIRALTNPPVGASMANTAWWRRAEIPAANGHGNARSVAAIQDAIARGGETGGVRLLSEKGCDAIFEEQANGTDLVLRVPMRMGMGYGLSGELVPMGPRTCFWGGYGGSLILMDQDLRLTVCYVMNRMEGGLVGDLRGPAVLMAAVQAALPG
jgi:CubicO group peptidase (beta-lactamase class C family)